MNKFLTLVILGITLGLFISSQTKPIVENILGENTFGSLEHQKEKNVK